NVPPVGAAEVSVIVAVEVAPATTLVGFKLIDATAALGGGGGGGGGGGTGGGGFPPPPLPGPDESGPTFARFGATARSFEQALARTEIAPSTSSRASHNPRRGTEPSRRR